MFFWLPIFTSVITNVADLRHAVWSDLHAGDEFSLTCTVTSEIPLNNSFTVMDDTGHCYLRTTNRISPKAGQRVKINGHIGIDPFNWQRAFLEHAEPIGEGALPPPTPITPEQLNDESFDNRTVIMRGIVTDIVPDATAISKADGGRVAGFPETDLFILKLSFKR